MDLVGGIVKEVILGQTPSRRSNPQRVRETVRRQGEQFEVVRERGQPGNQRSSHQQYTSNSEMRSSRPERNVDRYIHRESESRRGQNGHPQQTPVESGVGRGRPSHRSRRSMSSRREPPSQPQFCRLVQAVDDSFEVHSGAYGKEGMLHHRVMVREFGLECSVCQEKGFATFRSLTGQVGVMTVSANDPFCDNCGLNHPVIADVEGALGEPKEEQSSSDASTPRVRRSVTFAEPVTTSNPARYVYPSSILRSPSANTSSSTPIQHTENESSDLYTGSSSNASHLSRNTLVSSTGSNTATRSRPQVSRRSNNNMTLTNGSTVAMRLAGGTVRVDGERLTKINEWAPRRLDTSSFVIQASHVVRDDQQLSANRGTPAPLAQNSGKTAAQGTSLFIPQASSAEISATPPPKTADGANDKAKQDNPTPEMNIPGQFIETPATAPAIDADKEKDAARPASGVTRPFNIETPTKIPTASAEKEKDIIAKMPEAPTKLSTIKDDKDKSTAPTPLKWGFGHTNDVQKGVAALDVNKDEKTEDKGQNKEIEVEAAVPTVIEGKDNFREEGEGSSWASFGKGKNKKKDKKKGLRGGTGGTGTLFGSGV